ncbi:MAG: VanW family protein [Candidatus Uhrbacteria bacterium GW2011_GWE2_46_68]|uniref:VanW family protein n=2 Tax=Candidatus Uhriibacteriota TaxID=1752732 RepID=A0A0G1T4H3_9BACT|nr:MAG: VanW family protein [Candidatus Uhrbacteria bacterium GW2011_GWF2_46_218]KKU40330.1 MAG: VanW family protein [Candidatus Uhrbacteria bacterium GW2011_GWE2_46_68]
MKTVLIVSMVLAGCGVALFGWAQTYQGRLGPQVWIGGRFVGGLSFKEAQESTQQVVDHFLVNGVVVRANGEERTLTLATLVGTDMVERASFDVDTALLQAQINRHTSWFANPFLLVWNIFFPVRVSLPVTIQEELLLQDVRNLFPEIELEASEPTFVFILQNNEWTGEVVSGKSGNEINRQKFLDQLRDHLTSFDTLPVILDVRYVDPTISVTQAQAQMNQALLWLTQAPLTFRVTRGDLTETIVLEQEDLKTMIIPSLLETPTISKEAFDLWTEMAAASFEQQAVNAKFIIENGRVIEFVSNTPGYLVDHDFTYQNLLAFFQEEVLGEIEMVFIQTQPEISVSEVNDMGIAEKLGVGTSSYRGSPYNRILNITNGVRLLNGVLIAPDQTFSLLDALRPFDYDHGYYSELVIKGDKIEPEMGGGLCQIGTTTFRAALNTGLPIVERSNHSLVVSYYNDPQNGNPGTDATIYDPAPDLKFTNDTGYFILFQAEMNTQTQQLVFTFWGASDGRQASYSAPIVSSWIPVGETQKIETLDLEPGEEKCQSAHIGANASFVYTVRKSDGTIEERTFESHYRPLPEICLIGVEELTPIMEEGAKEESTIPLEDAEVLEEVLTP